MTPRLSQEPAIQGAEEERKGDVQISTSTVSRSPGRRSAGASLGGVDSSAVQQGQAVRKSGKKAVITTGGHQYLVSEGDELEVEKLESENPSTGSTGSPQASSGQGNLSFEAMMVIDGDKVSVGMPTVASVKVNAEVIDAEVKADKVVAIRFKAKKRVHTRRGHRQKLMRIKITKIA